MSKIPLLKDLDSAQRILVSKKIDPLRMLAEWNYLSKLADNYEESTPLPVGLKIYEQGHTSTLDGQLKVQNVYSDVQGLTLQVSGKREIAPSLWEKATVTYMSHGGQLGRMVEYKKFDSSGQRQWTSQSFIVSSGPEQGTIVRMRSRRSKRPLFQPIIRSLPTDMVISGPGLGKYYGGNAEKRRTVKNEILTSLPDIESHPETTAVAAYRGENFPVVKRMSGAWIVWAIPDFGDHKMRFTRISELKSKPETPVLPLQPTDMSVSDRGVRKFFYGTEEKTTEVKEEILESLPDIQEHPEQTTTATYRGETFPVIKRWCGSQMMWAIPEITQHKPRLAQASGLDPRPETPILALQPTDMAISNDGIRARFRGGVNKVTKMKDELLASLPDVGRHPDTTATATLGGKEFSAIMRITVSCVVWALVDFDEHKVRLEQASGLPLKPVSIIPLQERDMAISANGIGDRFHGDVEKMTEFRDKLLGALPDIVSYQGNTATAVLDGEEFPAIKCMTGTYLAWAIVDFEKHKVKLAQVSGLRPKDATILPLRDTEMAISIDGIVVRFKGSYDRVTTVRDELLSSLPNVQDHSTSTAVGLLNGEEFAVARRIARNRFVWALVEFDAHKNRFGNASSLELRPSVDFTKFTEREFRTFIRDNNIDELIMSFGGKPYFGKLLSVLRAGAFAGTRISDFMPRIADFETGVSVTDAGGRSEISQEERTAYIQAVLAAYRTQELDLSERGCKQSRNLLIRISRPQFETDAAALLKELYEEAETYQGRVDLDEIGQKYFAELYLSTATYFEKILDLRDMIAKNNITNTSLYPYQIEGVEHLVEKERAILAYGTGLGKTKIAISAVEVIAAESGEPKTTLWITDATNKEKIKREILKHSSLDPGQERDKVQVIISGKPEKRADQLERIDEANWRIITYQQLVSLDRNYPEQYSKLLSGVDVLVVDEAHMMGNHETWQSKAVQKIKTRYAFLLSATPCKNQLEDYYPLFNFLYPDEFKSLYAFRDMYARTVDGVQKLQTDAEDIVLFRSAEETLPQFNASQTTFPSIPKKVRLIDPDQWITYEMLPKSFDIIHDMLSNFSEWMRQRYQNTPQGQRLTQSGFVNALLVFTELLQASYLTKRYQIAQENPIWKAVDPVVEEAVRGGEKLNMWAFHTELIDGMEERYSQYGFRRLDGTIRGTSRENAVRDFQDSGVIPLLGASSIGGMGLDLYADRALFLEPPPTIQRLLQTEGRNLRVIGPDNAAYGRPEVRIQFVVPSYPKRLLKKVSNPKIRSAMERGPLPKWIIARLEKGEKLHQWLLEGGDPKDADLFFKASVLEAMGVIQNETEDIALAVGM